MKKKNRQCMAVLLIWVWMMLLLAGCGISVDADKVVIYSNADTEAIAAMTAALDAGGYRGKYVFETYGTGELGGKLLIEGAGLEADIITMSTFYIQETQKLQSMFLPLEFVPETVEPCPEYAAPLTSQEGAIIVNTQLLQEYGLPMPTQLKDLADPVYAGHLAVTDPQSSTTGWLLLQALIHAYGEEEAQRILSLIYANAGDHVESSGSAPLKLCKAGEVAIGFGLRHQAVSAKAEGLPVDYVDPVEGNFSLTESLAVVDKGTRTKELALEMAQCILKDGRADLMEHYPNPLYLGETGDADKLSAYPSVFPEELTFALYNRHLEISEAAKP